MRILILMLGLLSLAACMSATPRNLDPDAAPPDFALVLTVLPGDAADAGPAPAPAPTPGSEAGGAAPLPEPLRRPAQHILTPDRVLRVAFGPGVHPGLYPPPTASLSPAQVNRLWAVVREHGLTEPQPDAAGGPNYVLAITALGRQTRYTTSPAASRGVGELAALLVEYRGEQLDEPAAP